jgi:protein involved in polysaccharide export with SLBB domain
MFTRAKTVLDSQAIARQANHRPTQLSAMKPRIFATALLLIVPTILAAQTQTRDRRASEADRPASSESNSMRDRVVGPKVSNHSTNPNPRTDEKPGPGAPAQGQGQPSWGNSAFIIRPSSVERGPSSKIAPGDQTVEVASQQLPVKKLVQPTSLSTASAKPDSANSNPRALSPARSPVATSTYNVGIGDVLDVRLSNASARESTLFTVMKNGTLEYPLLNGPVSVAGLTTDEISRVLSSEIKVIKAPRVTVTVRDYASHAVVIGGLVDSPGRKVLRREAMPLFAVLAEALVRPEATAVTILRNGKEGEALSLKDDQAMATLVAPGDVIKISGAPVAAGKFLYVGGEVAAPGEKAFREGMTLTQALLSAGGASQSGKTIKVARRNSTGYLSTNEYNLRSIEDGKTPDPVLEAGDRIEVTRGT